MSSVARQVVLRAHPEGAPKASDFAIATVPMPTPAEGEVLLRTLYLALDPLIRFALDKRPLTGPNAVGLDEYVYGPAVAQVVESRSAGYQPGDIVDGRTGWREFAVADPAKVVLRKVDATLGPVSAALGALGMPGQTAHACIIEIGRVKAGETVVISAAAGAVGSTAGQIAKILGARVVGIAGTPAKCAALEALGFDACVNYRAPDYAERLAAACPDKVDVYVESVGGAVTQAVLPLFNYRARMPVCGFIAYYGVGMEGPGPDRMPGFLRTVMSRGLEVRGFGGAMVAGKQALDDLAGWVRDGRLQMPETVVEGLENVPAAFAGVFGANDFVGKLIVRVGAA